LTQEITNIVNNLIAGKEIPVTVHVNVTQTNQTTPVNQTTQIPVCKTDEVYNSTDKECVAKPVPVINQTKPPVVNETKPPIPTPTPVEAKAFSFIVVGDVEKSTAGTAVFNQIKAQNPDYIFVLGDMGYGDFEWFKSSYGSLGDKMYCMLGNHDALEDGTAALQKAALDYCGYSYWLKESSTLFMVYNTNGDFNTQLTGTDKVFKNSTIMNGVKNIHIMSHKACAVPPNSHHPLEIKGFCDALKAKIPAGIKVYYDQAHNHVYSESADKSYKQIGTGGKSHYTCPTTQTSAWYCDNAHYGFVKYTVKADGTTTSSFIDYTGKMIH
jgi:hypothetical protein